MQMRGTSGLTVILVVILLAAVESLTAAEPEIPRDFELPLPLFAAPGSAWVENATTAEVLPESDQQILTYYRVLCGDDAGLVGVEAGGGPILDVAYDEFTLPVFLAGAGHQSVDICNYDGEQSYPNEKWGVDTLGGPVTVPSSAGLVRPSNPLGAESDGWLVLYDPTTFTSYDFWQASTSRDGPCRSHGGGLVGSSIVEAGYPDFFDIRSNGVNPPGAYSARAMGTPLLAGAILPEDVESGSIDHALALGIMGPRNLSSDPTEPLATDIFYPAATTETDHFSTNQYALAAGQRFRAKATLVDGSGNSIDEAGRLAPITRMIFAALRTYGAYVVDNAGAFTFWAEDIHTAVLDLSDDEVNALIGEPPGTPIPAGATKWQVVIEAVNADLWEISIPFAYGDCSGASSSVITANFEVVAPATGTSECIPPAITSNPDGATIPGGDSATLSVVATGTAPLAFRWYRGSSGDTSDAIAGATGTSYTTPSLEESTSYWVRVTNACGEADSSTATVTVTPSAGGEYVYLIPAVAHNPGAGGTLWRTDVAAINPSTTEADLVLTFYAAVGGQSLTASESLEPGATQEWGNIMESVFSQTPASEAGGSIAIGSTVPLIISARTYNQTSEGTFGQYIPACTPAKALGSGVIGYLPQLKDNAAYRTNVGAINIGDSEATIEIQVFGGDGDRIGGSKSLSVATKRWKQVNDVFDAVGAGEEQDIAFATVTVSPADGRVWVYASVVDNQSGDPTTIPVLLLGED